MKITIFYHERDRGLVQTHFGLETSLAFRPISNWKRLTVEPDCGAGYHDLLAGIEPGPFSAPFPLAEQSLDSERGRTRSVSNHKQVVDAILSLEDEERNVILRDFLRSLVHRIDLLFDTQQLNIHYSLKEFERKTVIVFKSGKSVVFLEDEPEAHQAYLALAERFVRKAETLVGGC
jgi:hypothetical protein